MTDEEIARRARALELQKLAERFPDDLSRALAGAEALARRLPRDHHWTAEPAHVYTLTPRKGAAR
jgi:hypothetical protein